MVHPQYRVADHADDLQPEQSLTPIYPLTTGVTQQRLRQLIAQALELATRDAALLRALPGLDAPTRSEEHTSELQSLMRISYAVFCLKKKKHNSIQTNNIQPTRMKA